nr:zinc finger MYM-type protein 5-like [Hydra vulgaris]
MSGIENTIGIFIPPVFINPRARFHNTMIRGGPPGCIGYANSPTSFGTENDVTDISESSGEPLSKIRMVAVNEENILVLSTEEPIATIPSNDPALWAHLSKVKRDSVLLQGLPRNPSAFPKDSNKKKVPESIFYETSLNGEKTCRDWLVWSVSKKSFICFPCSLFGSKQSFGIGHQSHLLRWNDGISCNWHKLPEKIKSHQNNAQH